MRVSIRRSVRILLVGDRGVGKTSLILSLVSEEFPEDVPPKAEEITIPADVIPEMVPTHIVDYSAVEQSEDQLLDEVRRAHVICVVYSVDDERTLLRVTTHWLPLLRDTLPHSRSPVILVGNKVDLIEDTTVESAEEIMEEYPEIESFVECSAKSLKNISEMFYYAQKAVLHPTGPVYVTEKQDLIISFCLYVSQSPIHTERTSGEDVLEAWRGSAQIEELDRNASSTCINRNDYIEKTQKRHSPETCLHPTTFLCALGFMYGKLTEDCKKALTRIFRVCDLDNDGLLNDSELNAFQKRCFDMPLRPEAMEDVKAVLRRNIAGGVSTNNCITLTGFLYLHCLFIQRGRSHTTWTVLRKFGYNEHLHLSKDYLFPPIRVPNGSTTELSHKGQQFFTKLFLRYDKDRDGALSPVELGQLFSVCPSPVWGSDIQNIVPTNEKGWITLKGFLCFWNLTTLQDLSTTFEYLAYFGYPISDIENQISAIQVTRERKLDLLKKQSTRNVYECHVIGAKGVGKSSLCRSLLGHTLDKLSEGLSGVPQKTINIVHVYGQEKFLMMKDVEVRNVSEPLTHTDVHCDVVCLVYDASNAKSFEYIARIYLKYFNDGKVPVLIVCNKCDLFEVRQDYLVQPHAFCDAHRLSPPHKFSVEARSSHSAASSALPSSSVHSRELFQKLATMAAFPHLTELSLCGDSVVWKAGLGIALVTAVGLIIARLITTERR